MESFYTCSRFVTKKHEISTKIKIEGFWIKFKVLLRSHFLKLTNLHGMPEATNLLSKYR